MRVTDLAIYRGPHRYSVTPMIRFELDLKQLEQHPTNTLPGFHDELLTALHGLQQHGCNLRRPGALLNECEKERGLGTWLNILLWNFNALPGRELHVGKLVL